MQQNRIQIKLFLFFIVENYYLFLIQALCLTDDNCHKIFF